MDTEKTKEIVNNTYNESIISTLESYIRIPNQSPSYDPEVLTNGYQDQAVQLLHDWVQTQPISGLNLEILSEPERTPIIFGIIEPSEGYEDKKPVLMYGHLDKQPPLTEQWKEGLGPYDPVIVDGKLYGRGGADDGYALFAAITAVKAIQAQSGHGKIVVLIEACEESGSFDLPFWIEKVNERIGDVALVVCLDSGCANYEQMWMTTSLRGCISVVLDVSILEQGVHSGSASGIVPSSFRIIRELLDRIEDSSSGKVLLEELYTDIPEIRVKQAEEAAAEIGNTVYSEFPFVEGAQPVSEDLAKLLLQRTWEPQVAYVGIEGIPGLSGGNVLRTNTSLKLSIRIPPHVESDVALEAIRRELTRDPPYGAKIELNDVGFKSNGWESPPLEDWLQKAIANASTSVFGKPVRLWGEGFSIPFMGMLGEKFPEAQFVITGVLGPQSNAHGPNEFLHIEMAKNLTSCVALIIENFFKQ